MLSANQEHANNTHTKNTICIYNTVVIIPHPGCNIMNQKTASNYHGEIKRLCKTQTIDQVHLTIQVDIAYRLINSLKYADVEGPGNIIQPVKSLTILHYQLIRNTRTQISKHQKQQHLNQPKTKKNLIKACMGNTLALGISD